MGMGPGSKLATREKPTPMGRVTQVYTGSVMTHAMSLDLRLFFSFHSPSLLRPFPLSVPLKGYYSVTFFFFFFLNQFIFRVYRPEAQTGLTKVLQENLC